MGGQRDNKLARRLSSLCERSSMQVISHSMTMWRQCECHHGQAGMQALIPAHDEQQQVGHVATGYSINTMGDCQHGEKMVPQALGLTKVYGNAMSMTMHSLCQSRCDKIEGHSGPCIVTAPTCQSGRTAQRTP